MDSRQAVDEQAAAEQAKASAEQERREQDSSQRSAAEPQGESPGARTPGEDGAAARDADEDALRGDVDELVAVAAQRDEYLALAQRTQADFENYRKRVVRESTAAHERGIVRLAEELLPALDNLDRALDDDAAERTGGDDALLTGVRLVRSELRAALARMGIKCFSPQGDAFDPTEHEAMAQKPVAEAQSGTVVEVVQPGYRLGETIIRPARVVVAA